MRFLFGSNELPPTGGLVAPPTCSPIDHGLAEPLFSVRSAVLLRQQRSNFKLAVLACVMHLGPNFAVG